MSSVAAFFDVDGTLVKSNIVDYYIHFATRDLTPLQRTLWLAGFAFKGVFYFILDLISRSRFNEVFYRNYRGLPIDQMATWSQVNFEQIIRPRIYPSALDCINQHKARQERIVLVTGSLDFIMAPLAEFLDVDATLATSLTVENNHYTGQLSGLAVGEEEKARLVNEFAEREGINLSQSYAYGDSHADLPMLNVVGHPVAINPDAALNKAAEREGYAINSWHLPDLGTAIK